MASLKSKLAILVACVAAPSMASATLLDVYDSTSGSNVFVDNIHTIDTAQTGAQHYNYFSASAHPTDVNLGTYNSNIWVHQNTNTGEFSFGFVFSIDNSPDSFNVASLNFRIINSDTDVYVSQSDDPGEAVESSTEAGVFSASYRYGYNTDGIMVSGITGTDWTIIIDAVDFGDVQNWYAASGDTPSDFSTDLSLTLGNEYRITLNENDPSTAPVTGGPEVNEVPEPTSLALLGLGSLLVGFQRRKKRI